MWGQKEKKAQTTHWAPKEDRKEPDRPLTVTVPGTDSDGLTELWYATLVCTELWSQEEDGAAGLVELRAELVRLEEVMTEAV